MPVLVVHSSCHGSTRGVAERIARRLAQVGFDAELHAAGDVVDPACYDAVVIGSAVHGGKWLPEAAGFVRSHAPVLRARPVWLFSVSTVGDEESMFPDRVARRLRAARKEPAELAGFRRLLGARDHRNFAGTVEPSDWPAGGRLVFRLFRGRYGDHRNWAAIDAWAERIAGQLEELRSQRAAPGRS